MIIKFNKDNKFQILPLLHETLYIKNDAKAS